MIRVLFVCLGNICRSPMAEAVFRELVTKEGLAERFVVDSAGIGNWHVGEVPHEGTRKMLDDQQISYENIITRQIHKNDWNDFDYIIAMDDQNIKDLQNINQNNNGVAVSKLMDYVGNPTNVNVPDPYFTGNFEYTYELISEGCRQLLKYISKTHNI